MGKIITNLSLRDVLVYSGSPERDRYYSNYDIKFLQPFGDATPEEKLRQFWSLLISDINKEVIPQWGIVSHIDDPLFKEYGSLPVQVLKDIADQETVLEGLILRYKNAPKRLIKDINFTPAHIGIYLYGTPNPHFGETLTFYAIPELYKDSTGPVLHFYQEPMTEKEDITLQNIKEALKPFLNDNILNDIARKIMGEKVKIPVENGPKPSGTSGIEYYI